MPVALDYASTSSTSPRSTTLPSLVRLKTVSRNMWTICTSTSLTLCASATHTICFPPSPVTARRCTHRRLRTTVFLTAKFGEISGEADHLSSHTGRSPRGGPAPEGCCFSSRAAGIWGRGKLHRRRRAGARISASRYRQTARRAPLERPAAVAAPPSAAHLLCWIELPGSRRGIEDGSPGSADYLYEAAIRHHWPG